MNPDTRAAAERLRVTCDLWDQLIKHGIIRDAEPLDEWIADVRIILDALPPAEQQPEKEPTQSGNS